MIKKFIYVLAVIVLLGAMAPVLWPMFVGTDTDIQAMTETDDATVMFQAIWPVVLLVLGIGLCAGLIFFGLRKFGLMGR